MPRTFFREILRGGSLWRTWALWECCRSPHRKYARFFFFFPIMIYILAMVDESCLLGGYIRYAYRSIIDPHVTSLGCYYLTCNICEDHGSCASSSDPSMLIETLLSGKGFICSNDHLLFPDLINYAHVGSCLGMQGPSMPQMNLQTYEPVCRFTSSVAS